MAAPSGQPVPDAKSARKARRRGNKELARSGAILVLAVLVIVFAVLNSKQVQVDWILGSGKAPLIIVILISLLVGIVLTSLAGRRARRKKG